MRATPSILGMLSMRRVAVSGSWAMACCSATESLPPIRERFSNSVGTVTLPIGASMKARGISQSFSNLKLWPTWLMRFRTACIRPKDFGSSIPRMSVRSLMLPPRVLLSSSFSATISRYCASASATATAKTSCAHGLVRNRKIFPSFTTLMAPSRSALPVSMMRTVSGARSRTSERNWMPSIFGICRSEMTTA